MTARDRCFSSGYILCRAILQRSCRAAACGWTTDICDDDAIRQLLAMNLDGADYR